MGSEFFLGDALKNALPEESESIGANMQRCLDDVFSLAYEELRRLARSVQRNEAHASVTPTTIVHEAWMKLARTPSVASLSPLHFKRIAARAMRQVLVDKARLRRTQVRGAGAERVTFDESLYPGRPSPMTTDREVLALDAALDALARLEPRQAALVEARFFGGLEMNEIAELLEISPATALRDWRAAKAWLATEVRRALP